MTPMRLFRPAAPLFMIFFAAAFLSSCAVKPGPSDAAKSILIQHNGRVKSLDAFSRQTVELISGKQVWDGKSPVLLILEALYYRDSVKEIRWVRVDYSELVSHLGLPPERHHFAYREIFPAVQKIESLVQSARQKRDRDLRPSKLEQKAESLYTSLIEVSFLASGESIKTIPSGEAEGAWLSPFVSEDPLSASFKKLVTEFGEEKVDAFRRSVGSWNQAVDSRTAHRHRSRVNLEIRYLDLRPFEIAWIGYLLSFLLLAFLKKNRALRILGIGLLAVAVFFHTYGLVLRCLILSRPPVSNMYESMVFMNWVLILAAVLFAFVRKNLVPVSVGALISGIVMIYGNLLPMDTSLEVLVPVLRSNYWLTIHVLTIVSSYGVFGLAMGLGHRHLVLELMDKLSPAEEERSAQMIHRVIQVGVLLLGAGTVLGGVWANESWGRFWGWDPKETWALITFLGYLILVHLKYAKKISNFWLAMSAVLGFLLVLMTWYGVNFVLGRGLHSYGQGSGGMIWVILYLALEVLFAAWVILKKYGPPAKA